MQAEIKRGLIYSVVMLGVSSVVLQVLLMREILAYTGGNELIIGVYLSFWMLFTGLGSFLGGRLPVRNTVIISLLTVILLITATLSHLSVPLVRSWEGSFVATPGVWEVIILTSAALLLPCLLLGALFPILAGLLFSGKENRLASNAYGLEALGSVAGGLAFTVLLLIFLENRIAWIFLITANLPGIAVTAWHSKRRVSGSILIIVSVALLLGWSLYDPEAHLGARLFPGQVPVGYADTPSGRVVVTKDGNQLNVFENSLPVFSTGDVVAREEPFHLGMSYISLPAEVLVVGAGNPVIIEEGLKYEGLRLDYLSSDPWMHRLLDNFFMLPENERAGIIFADPVLYLRKPGKKYDLILILTPDPATAATNRFYTAEFYELCKERLTGNGMLLTSLSYEGNYLNEESVELHSLVLSTLNAVFEEVDIVSLNRNYFIAGRMEFQSSFFRHGRILNTTNLYFNEYYLNEDMIVFRSQNIRNGLNMKAPVNSNLHPRGYYLQIDRWLSLFDFDLSVLVYPSLVLLVLLFILLKPVQTGIFTGGFTASALLFLVLVTFQSLHGYVYLLVALFVAVFMGGLGLGALLFNRFFKIPALSRLAVNQVFIGLSALALPLLAYLLATAPNLLVYAGFALITLVSGLLMGFHFGFGTLLTTGSVKSSAAGNYAADLAGSALGAFFIALFLFPLTGMVKSCLILAGMNLAVVLILVYRGKKS